MLGKIKWVFGELVTNWDDKWWWKKRLRNHILRPVVNSRFGTDGIAVMEKDWDNLIILDASRRDVFEKVIDTDEGYYTNVKSRGSATGEWATRNFAGRKFGETIYVTANPQISRHAPSSFHKLIETWKTEYSKEHGTVLPEAVRKAAVDNFDETKRLIVHFMQPHYPFIGRDWEFNSGWDIDKQFQKESEGRPRDPWDALEMGIINRDKLWSAYVDNMKLGWDSAKKLMLDLDGKTVVTSDHGNLFGEYWTFGHPFNFHVPELDLVPWLEFDGERREVLDEGVQSVGDEEREFVEKRLRQFGYI